MNLKEMLEKRAKLIADVRALKEKVAGEKRELTAEERASCHDMLVAAENLRDKVSQKLADDKADKDLEAAEQWKANEPIGRQTAPTDPNRGQTQAKPETFTFRRGGREQTMELRGYTATPEYNQSFRSYLASGRINATLAEARTTLQADNDVGGGYITAPQQFVARLIMAVDNLTFMRQIATVLPAITQADSIGVPTLETKLNDADWTAEIKAAIEDTSLAFGKRELRPHPCSKLVKISKTLIRKAVVDPEQLVRDRIAYACAVTCEKAYMVGTGAEQPLGIFTPSANGIPTSQDIATGNTATAATLDGLKKAKYFLKSQYWNNLTWVMHRDLLSQVDTLKDGEGRYIWQQSIVVGQPDRLLNYPIQLSEYAPNTFTANQYVAVLGDFSWYWIADALSMTIQALMELYAVTNQNGYLSRLETDGAPVLAEAFARVKLGA